VAGRKQIKQSAGIDASARSGKEQAKLSQKAKKKQSAFWGRIGFNELLELYLLISMVLLS
jgi:hypothetical protein